MAQNIKSSGLSAEPCGVPAFHPILFDIALSWWTLRCLFVENELSNRIILVGKPTSAVHNLYFKPSNQTASKAFPTSRNTPTAFLCFLRAVLTDWDSLNNW